MDWLKLNSKGILRGSLSDASNISQLVWIKFLAMANETRDRDGYLRYAPGKPYPENYIATVCHITTKELTIAIEDFLDDVRDGKPRIQYAEDGSIFLTNWAKYQDKPITTKDLSSRLKTVIEREAITRKMANENPDAAMDALSYGHEISSVDTKTGEILRDGNIHETKTTKGVTE